MKQLQFIKVTRFKQYRLTIGWKQNNTLVSYKLSYVHKYRNSSFLRERKKICFFSSSSSSLIFYLMFHLGFNKLSIDCLYLSWSVCGYQLCTLCAFFGFNISTYLPRDTSTTGSLLSQTISVLTLQRGLVFKTVLMLKCHMNFLDWKNNNQKLKFTNVLNEIRFLYPPPPTNLNYVFQR